VQINQREFWTLDETDSAHIFWETLNRLLGGTSGTDPQVWIEDRPTLETRDWYVRFRGKEWSGEPLINLGTYDIRARLRGDAEVKKPDPPQHPMKTRSQAAAAAAKKAEVPPQKPIVSDEALQKMMAPKPTQGNTPQITMTPPSKNPPLTVQPKPAQAPPPPKQSFNPTTPPPAKDPQSASKGTVIPPPKTPTTPSPKPDTQPKKPAEKPPQTTPPQWWFPLRLPSSPELWKMYQ
jgi:hypothetical protein